MKDVKYSEPKSYFSRETRKKFGLGEYNKENKEKSKKEREKKKTKN